MFHDHVKEYYACTLEQHKNTVNHSHQPWQWLKNVFNATLDHTIVCLGE